MAAVLGLAVLSALYFSQARDVKRLREWAGRAPERSGRGITAMPRRSQPRYSRVGSRYVAVALVGLLVVGGGSAYGVTQLIGGGESSGNEPKRNGAGVKPGNVTVAVLNATTVPGLAAMLSDQIGAAGFRKGTIDDYSDKQLAESVVQYAPGHRAEAKVVSRRLGISQLEPVAANSRALAKEATAIVIAGADKGP
jgi:LytR cell envelope-related transcriptional attenuator